MVFIMLASLEDCSYGFWKKYHKTPCFKNQLTNIVQTPNFNNELTNWGQSHEL